MKRKMYMKRHMAGKNQSGPHSAVSRAPNSCQRSWVRYPVWPHTFVSPSADLRRAVVSYWRKYVHEVLVNRLGSLSLPRKSVVRINDRPDMTLDVYHGCKTTTQQQQPVKNRCSVLFSRDIYYANCYLFIRFRLFNC